ncbi:MAG: hypothetical protein ACTHLJ_00540 [Angustibacter sp.]
MRRIIVKAGVLAGLVTAVSAGPASAYTWATEASPIIAKSGSTSAAAGYGTWYVNGSGYVTFYPNIKTYSTAYDGAYANAFHSVSNTGVTYTAGPTADTPRWDSTTYKHYAEHAQLPTAGGYSYVKTIIQVGQDRSWAADPTAERLLPTQRY